MKVWTKINFHGDYHSHNIAQAVYGFRELGAEIIKYHKIDEIYDLVSREDIVLDYIDQIKTIFNKFNVEIPNLDYPVALSNYYGRTIWRDTINSINSNPEKWGIFVKPIREKAFTGKIIKDTSDLVGCGSCYENYEVYCSEILNIKREWRAFILYDELIDIRPYNGDYHYQYNTNVLDSVIKSFCRWEERPMACSIDFAVIEDGFGNKKTIVVEVNDAYALGCYGLNHIDYAKLISARWAQLLNRKDEYKF